MTLCTRHPLPSANARRTAFTLVELLVVMGIIAILIAIVTPATRRVLSGMHLTQSTELLVSQLRYASQTALSKNRSVEVRFYQVTDPGVFGSATAIRALQLWQLNADGTRTPLGNVQRFPGSVIAADDASLTNLGDYQQANSTLPPSERPSTLPTSYQYKTFQFKADGTTTLDPASRWFITIKNEHDQGSPPANFSTVQIEPLTGGIRLYRP